MNQLPGEDQLLLRQLFWDGARQRRIARVLHVSQQEVSRRKRRALRRLRRVLNDQSRLYSHFLTVCWALLDSLDGLPGVNLL